MFDVKKFLAENRISLTEAKNPADKNLSAAADKILYICKQIRISYGWKIDNNSEWLGPWIHRIEDEAKKINKQLGYK